MQNSQIHWSAKDLKKKLEIFLKKKKKKRAEKGKRR